MMRFCNYLHKPVISLLFLVLISSSLFAQRDSRVRIATLLKNSGNYEQALDLYLQIYKSGKISKPLINDIQECYEKLKRYKEAIQFLNEIIKRFPDDFEYRVKLGRAYYLNGEQEAAFTLWEQLIQKNPKNAYLYRIIGSALIELRLYDKAVQVYETAIKNANRQQSLYRDIAMIYRAQLNYKEAAASYLNYYRFYPKQFGYVRSQIISMTGDSAVVLQIIEAIKEHKKEFKAQTGVDEILADLFLRAKEYDQAFSVYLELHRKSPKTNYLYRFINKVSSNRAYSYAVKGLKLLLKESKTPKQADQYRLELARNYYLWGVQFSKKGDADEAQKKVDLALKITDRILSNQSPSVYHWAALELKGDIFLDFYEDTDRAIQNYSLILKTKSYFRNKDRVRFKLARAHLIKGDLENANQYMNEIKSPSYQTIVQYFKAEELFYKGKLTGARKAFAELSVKLRAEDSLSNNVLGRMILLNRAQQDSALLAKYGEAEFLIRQKKLSEAARIFEQLAYSNSELSPQCAERAAELLTKLGKYDRVEALVKEMNSRYPDYVNMDRLIFILASAEERQKRWEDAFQSYRMIMTNYPDSFYLEKARERARRLKDRIIKDQVQ
ncbi:MAG: tetratricopeptide repeat protein [Calditrichaeota bacterium]|nr:tetratricopeptide repeat protein [Calditrichota bacterium]